MIKVSASMFKDWKLCKRRWYYHRYRTPQGIPERESSYFVLGRVVHTAVELFEQGHSAEDLSASIPKWTYEQVMAAGERMDYGYGHSLAKINSLAGELFQNYLVNRGKHYSNAAVEESEKQFVVPMTEATGIQYELIGKIDQVVRILGPREGEDKIILVDLKTSTKEPSVYDVAWDYQFSIYALAWLHLYDYIPKVYNFHLRSGKLIHYPRSADYLHDVQMEIGGMVFDLENRKYFSRHAGYHCNTCPYREHCYANRGDTQKL